MTIKLDKDSLHAPWTHSEEEQNPYCSFQDPRVTVDTILQAILGVGLYDLLSWKKK